MRGNITIGSRGSKLALIQAKGVLAELRELNPGFDFSFAMITTKGDLERKVSLDRMAGVGVFVKELEEALLDGRIDMAVHSFKDMLTEIPSRAFSGNR